MEKLQTITEYQLLFLARKELSRRIDELKTELIKSEQCILPRRKNILLKMYTEQFAEITKNMAEINRDGDNE